MEMISLMVICLSSEFIGIVVGHLWKIGDYWLVILESQLGGQTAEIFTISGEASRPLDFQPMAFSRFFFHIPDLHYFISS